MIYNTLSKSQLWTLVKERNLTGLTWQSSKDAMIEALLIVDSAPLGSDGNFKPHDTQPTLTKSDVITKSHNDTQVEISKTICDNKITDVISDFSLWDSVYAEIVNTVVESVPNTAEKSEVVKERVATKPVVSQESITVSRTQIFMWSYLDHEMTGSWKQVVDESETQKVVEFLESLLQLPKQHPNHCVIQFPVHNCVVSLKMKPRIVQETDVNGRVLNRVDRQHQQNNLYANRQKTLMSTTETAGRNIGESSVKASMLYRKARYIAQPIRISDSWNYAGIDTIAINGRQVYPFSITAAYDETNVADNLVPTKILDKRKESATQRVAAKDFSYVRGTINNGLSPVFRDGNKNYCFQVDKDNRVSIWLLAKDAHTTASAIDLVKGRKLQDLGFLEVQQYTQPQFRNLTLDLVVGGKEARLERFDWIAKQLNKQHFENDAAILDYLLNLKNKDGNYLPWIKDSNGRVKLTVNNNLISGVLYGSQLLIKLQAVNKHRVVFHTVGKLNTVNQRFAALANTWLFSLAGSTLNDLVESKHNYRHRDSVIGIAKSNRCVETTNAIGERTQIKREKDAKYITKLLTRFTETGIYSGRDNPEYIGKLVKTDGSTLSVKQIERIAVATIANYPVNQPLATLFTPSHAANPDEWKVSFLNLLKVYASVEVAILFDGKLQKYNSGNEILTDWCKGVLRYLMSNNVKTDVLTIGDAIEMLQNTPYSSHKEVLLKVPTVAKLNSHELLTKYSYTQRQLQPKKVAAYRVLSGDLKSPYADAVKTVRNNNGLD